MQNGLRLGGGLITLVLLVRFLPRTDLGMYYVFIALTSFLAVLDGAFSANLSRYLGYALGGAESLRASGMSPPQEGAAPNWPLVHQLLGVLVWLYRSFAGFCGLLVLAVGTPLVWPALPQTQSPTLAAAAWAASVAAASVDVYASSWLTALRGLNRVRDAAQIGTVALTLRPLLLVLLFTGGAGLMALPAATLATALLMAVAGRHRLRNWLRQAAPAASLAAPSARSLLGVLWPNTWRVGLMLLSHYLASTLLIQLCARRLGLENVAAYGLTLQMANLAHTFASTWTLVKLPLATQYRAAGRKAELRRMLWSRVWLQDLSYLALAAMIMTAGPWVPRTLGSDKELLPQPWLALFLLNGFLWLGYSFWTHLITTENRVPSLWPAVASNILTVLAAYGLERWTSLEVGALVLAPLLSGLVFNYWYWAACGARTLGTTRLRFFLRANDPAG